MAQTPLNALQAILIRERLILYFETKRSELRNYSVRKLIEDIALSMANEGEAHAYQENEDFRDEGKFSATGYTLKNSTLDNLLARRASAISDGNLRLIRNFLLAEGFLTPDVLELCRRYPDLRLRAQFNGIAATDARLQRYRRALEGEYHAAEGGSEHSLWIAEPGRSKPFVSLRVLSSKETGAAHRSTLYEGRIFLMPADTTMVVEVSKSENKLYCRMHRLGVHEDSMILHHEARAPIIVNRLSPRNYLIARRFAHKPPDERPRVPFENLREILGGRDTARMPTPEHIAWNKAFMQAAREGDLPGLVLALLNGANINIREHETGRTAMHLAAARADLEMVQWLNNAGQQTIPQVKELLPGIELTDSMSKNLRALSYARHLLLRDQDDCFASAMAPVSTDDSDRNRRATEIWHKLFAAEIEMFWAVYSVSPLLMLDFWKPSSSMMEEFERYAAPLPAGFTDPKPD